MVYNFQNASEYIVDVAFKFPVAGSCACVLCACSTVCVQYTDLYMRASLAQLASQPSP